MSALVLCDDCDGQGWRLGAKCATCDGHGRLVPTAAREALIELLASVCDNGTARSVLDTLDGNRAALAAWQTETGMLRGTLKGLEPVPPSGPLVKPWSDGYVRPGTTRLVDITELGPDGKRLYTVDAPA